MKDSDRTVEFEPAGGQLLKLSMSTTRNIVVAAVAASIALPAAASEGDMAVSAYE